jgi:hypothetical protein
MVRRSISTFRSRVWPDCAFARTTPEEAFFVKCDRTTMTKDDIDNGRLICLHRRRPRGAGGVSDPLGGRLFVESEPGRRTTVRGELPAGSPL